MNLQNILIHHLPVVDTDPKQEVFWALNRKHKVVAILTGFSCFEAVQCAFRFGILLDPGISADAIGRSKTAAIFARQAEHSGYTVLKGA